jgi:hypothetical protein
MKLKTIIAQQGAPRVGEADIVVKTDLVICAYIDLDSKRLEDLMPTANPESNCPGLSFWAGKGSLHLQDGLPVSAPTYLEFPELKGWEVFTCSLSGRYTASVVLINKNVMLV